MTLPGCMFMLHRHDVVFCTDLRVPQTLVPQTLVPGPMVPDSESRRMAGCKQRIDIQPNLVLPASLLIYHDNAACTTALYFSRPWNHTVNSRTEARARSATVMTMHSNAPPRYVLASLAISLGGLINGYDTGSIGAVISMEQFTTSIGKLSPTLVGFTVSLIMLGGAVPSVFAGSLADAYGRLRVVSSGAMLFGVGALLQATATSLAQLLLGRTIAGLGEGVYLSNMAVYISEISPTMNRGVLAGLPQFMATVGICMGYFTCYGSVNIEKSSMAWRLPFIIMIILALALVGCCARLPESPRWLMSRGNHVEALDSVRRLEFSMVEAEREFLGGLGSGGATEQRLSLSPMQSFKLLFNRAYRARTVLALFVLGMVQLSGIDGVLYVSPS